MKCINCGTDNNLKDRTANQGRCKNCHHPFVFEPKTMGKVTITDPFFAKSIADISINNTLFFTPKQLFYSLEGRYKNKLSSGGFLFLYLFFNVWVTGFVGGISSMFLRSSLSFILVNIIYQIGTIKYLFDQSKSLKLNKKGRQGANKNLKIVGILIILISIVFGLFISQSFLIFCIYVIMGMTSLYLGFKATDQTELPQEFVIDQNEFTSWLNRWQEINGINPKVLSSPRASISPSTVNPDVTAYSFDRLVVCDSADIAQFLIANNFHFEHNCAILSITGYPQSIFDTTMTMLRRNPDLKVYALHDCSPQGMYLSHHLRTDENWFLNTNLVIIDVGITPRQVLQTKRGMFIQTSLTSMTAAKELPTEVRQHLSTEEIQWLEAGNFVELESISPLRLIKILQRGIAGNYTSLEGEDNDSGILMADTGSYLYTADSFG